MLTSKPTMSKKARDKLEGPLANALRGVMVEVRAKAPPPRSFARLYEAQSHAPSTTEALPSAPEKSSRTTASAPVPPTTTTTSSDDEALHDAFAGVKPLSRDGRERVPNLPPGTSDLRRGVMPSYRDIDADVRHRLGALVAGDLTFHLGREGDDVVFGVRDDAEADAWHPLTRESVIDDDALDLHGLRADDAEAATVKFVRSRYRRGARILRIVHGKGLHSAGGVSVLRDAVVSALTERGAAPLVLAFATAHTRLGGAGAMIVALRAKY